MEWVYGVILLGVVVGCVVVDRIERAKEVEEVVPEDLRGLKASEAIRLLKAKELAEGSVAAEQAKKVRVRKSCLRVIGGALFILWALGKAGGKK